MLGINQRGLVAFLGRAFLRVLACTSTFAVAQAAEPEPQAQRPTAQAVNMVCIDAEGRPVSGAEVHLFQLSGGEDGRFVLSGPFRTDAQGKAVCTQPVFSNASGNFDRWFYARVPGRLVGAARSGEMDEPGRIQHGGTGEDVRVPVG